MGGPLQGIRVFDMTHAGVGPWGTMILAAMGANVIKIEIPLAAITYPQHEAQV